MEEIDIKKEKIIALIALILPFLNSIVLSITNRSGIRIILANPFGDFSSFIVLLLLLLSLYLISKKVSNIEIFRNYLKAFTIQIAFLVVVLALFLTHGTLENMPKSLIVMILVLLYFSAIFSTYYMKKSFELIGNEFSNDYIKKGGDQLFWGVILTIILIGIIVAFVGWINIIIGFFRLPDKIQREVTVTQ
ncbi:DUF996 domain-containing protein [Caldisericum exile]|uniref:Hypothetical membrane protein n=1 Tax=Caldisericum exile (strain DSM 21853 / NBRC 104410 / AZM16c01) TaxID=511051 RepID=A0A7U6GFQ7_CALEA|nr:DUF996 domain-containing protein [Caldisericum exile]BAL81524.1 hypothetical membrane protein [Caldisericum exile AZM16c01]